MDYGNYILAPGEKEFMRILWHADEPMTTVAIRNEYMKVQNWPTSTIITVLNRLCVKGFVICDKSKKNILYQPAISVEEYRVREMALLLEKLYDNNIVSVIADLLNIVPDGKNNILKFLDSK